MGNAFAVQTPFPRGEKSNDGRVTIRPIRPQHVLAVEIIKRNRLAGTLDVLVGNNGELKYECVWCEADLGSSWFCMFALDIYDWKDLGSHTREIPARGCTGAYALPGGSRPATASVTIGTRITIPNLDVLDPFAP